MPLKITDSLYKFAITNHLLAVYRSKNENQALFSTCIS